MYKFSIEVTNPTQKIVFDHISKHERGVKLRNLGGIFDEIKTGLKMWSNYVLSVFNLISIETKIKEKTEK